MRIALILLIALLFIPFSASAGTGSGADYRPSVTKPGKNYEKNVRACQAHARNKSNKGEDMVIGGALGAAGGALIGGAISGDYGLGALAGAGAGAAGGHLSDEDDREQFVKDCMVKKGYTLVE